VHAANAGPPPPISSAATELEANSAGNRTRLTPTGTGIESLIPSFPEPELTELPRGL
jgi:hypothetical protein